MDWLIANAYTIVVAGALAAVVGLILRSMLRKSKTHSSCGCGGDCGHCSGCH